MQLSNFGSFGVMVAQPVLKASALQSEFFVS